VKTTAQMLAEFHAALGERHVTALDLELRSRLQDEETAELGEALADLALADYPTDELIAAVAHELADVVYVAYGTAHVLGIPLDRVIREVHLANMSKFGEDGKPILREDGKLLKSDSYIPPDIEHALACTCRPDEDDRMCPAHGSWETSY